MPSQTKSGSTAISFYPFAGRAAWKDLENIAEYDGLYATAALNDRELYSELLCAYDFGFSIPDGATITAITVNIARFCERGDEPRVFDEHVYLTLQYPEQVGLDRPSTEEWRDREDTVTYGGDLWGYESWDAEKINRGEFGICLSAYDMRGAKVTILVDSIFITVDYEEASSGCLEFVVV